MLVGGYKIIDLGGTPVTINANDGGTVVTGIYEAIEGNYHKATMLSGLVTKETVSENTVVTREYNDIFVNFGVESGDFTAVLDTVIIPETDTKYAGAEIIKIVIDDDDTVTVEKTTVGATDIPSESAAQKVRKAK